MSNFSINTNSGAEVALQSLSNIQTNLNKVQNEVSTGDKVSGAQDNAAVFAVAQGVRANLSAYDAVGTALNDGLSLNNVAITGATAVSNLLTNITGSLTQLADGSISEAQRQTYTSNLKSQIDEVQTFINSASYNGINLLGASQGTFAVTNGGFTSFTAPSNVSVLSGLGGSALTIHSYDLTGGTAGTDGFLGLARLVYQVATAVGTAGGTGTALYANDTNSAAFLANNTSGLISRSEVNQFEAIAALAAVSNSASAYQTAATGTYGNSAFGAALANFTTQVNAALGGLGADNNNIQLQITFVQSLSDSTNDGLGNLVDANLATASAQLTALQTQQQLATQALSIANSQPSNILSLFKNG